MTTEDWKYTFNVAIKLNSIVSFSSPDKKPFTKAGPTLINI